MSFSRLVTITFALLPSALAGQDHPHVPGMSHPAPTERTAQAAGQSAFAAIAEIVSLLDADPATDWGRVDLEQLRQHLFDMDDVVMRATVRTTPVAGGATFLVTGEGRVLQAIRRMAKAHGALMNAEGAQRVTVEDVPGGARVTVTATRGDREREGARIRGLGFIGLLTLGDHHGPHHLAMAQGVTPAGHDH